MGSFPRESLTRIRNLLMEGAQEDVAVIFKDEPVWPPNVKEAIEERVAKDMERGTAGSLQRAMSLIEELRVAASKDKRIFDADPLSINGPVRIELTRRDKAPSPPSSSPPPQNDGGQQPPQ